MAFNRDAQIVKLVEPHFLHGASLSIGEDNGFPYNFSFGLFKCVEDAGCAALDWRPCPSFGDVVSSQDRRTKAGNRKAQRQGQRRFKFAHLG